MDTQILNFFSFVSGKWSVTKDTWNDVNIEIYYHPAHSFNVDRMIEAIKNSLDYYSVNFSPYQFRQVRIIEFPGYRTFAQSYPNTISYSESAFFIEDLRDEKNIDMVYYITSHELAHQWWGHQVVGGDVQGATILDESLANYSALMVMEKTYGRDQMKRFLEYELNKYLRGRGQEQIGERPLKLVEQQAYIHYHKGSLALYALREYIGEEKLNYALKNFIKEKAFQKPPYTNSIELLNCLREVTPERFQYLIEDLFETITLYDNRTNSAQFVKTIDGKYKVTMEILSQKYRADDQGVETEVKHHDWIEIGVFSAEKEPGKTVGQPLYLEKRQIKSGETKLEIVVDKLPGRAGIDPRNLLIDRVPKDNLKGVSAS